MTTKLFLLTAENFTSCICKSRQQLSLKSPLKYLSAVLIRAQPAVPNISLLGMADVKIELCEIPEPNRDRSSSTTNQTVNLTEIKKELFKIARNNEKDQGGNVSNLKDLVQDLKPEEKKKLYQTKDENENTALHYAAKAGNEEICETLIQDGADPGAKGQGGMKVLPFAARYGDKEKAEEVWRCMVLIAKETKKKAQETSNPSVRKGKVKKMGKSQDLLDEAESMSQFAAQDRDKYNFNILHHAIQNTNWAKNPVVVKNLLATGNFRIADADKQGNTCLHLAAQFDKQDDDKIFDVFFDNENILTEEISRCIEKRNDLQMTPIHIACAVGNQDSLKALLAVCEKNNIKVQKIINDVDKNGFLPLCYAVTNKNLEMVKTLLENGAIPTQGTMLRAAR